MKHWQCFCTIELENIQDSSAKETNKVSDLNLEVKPTENPNYSLHDTSLLDDDVRETDIKTH